MDTDAERTVRRKEDHIRINLEEDVQAKGVTTGFESYRFVHQALPELDLSHIDLRCLFLGKQVQSPLLISSMTGGVQRAAQINRNLAVAAQTLGIALGLGSQRIALEQPDLAALFHVRSVAPDVLLFANLGAVQLNYGYTAEHCLRAVQMVDADALFLHLNPLQEAVQPGGNVNFAGLLSRIEAVCRVLPVPVVIKEVGWGISAEVATALIGAGVAAIDVAGAGGTSWSEVERHRADTTHRARVGAAFAGWGIPTATSLSAIRRAAPQLPLIASGGMRHGVDVAKALALGASLAGLASPVLRAATISAEAVVEELSIVLDQLRISMFCIGAPTIDALRTTPHLVPAFGP
jgi:isopentenyl-diphosphate delta-isomerase